MNVLPLYHRVFLSLRDQILNGAYDWREPMPSEKLLCSEFDVSRATIRHALDLLEEEGLIERRQGAPTFAKPLGYEASHSRDSLDQAAITRNYQELFAGDIQQHYTVIDAPKKLARQFANQKQLGRVIRVRESEGKAFCFVVTYMPLELAERIDWENLGDTPVITAISQLGKNFVRVEQVISATTADEESAVMLNTPIGSALLCVSGLFTDADGVTLMRKDGFFHSDSFEYRMTLYSKGV